VVYRSDSRAVFAVPDIKGPPLAQLVSGRPGARRDADYLQGAQLWTFFYHTVN